MKGPSPAVGLVQVLANMAGPMFGGWFTHHTFWWGLPGWQGILAATAPFVLLGLGLAAVSMPIRPIQGRWWQVRTSNLAFPWQRSALGTLVPQRDAPARRRMI